MKVLLQFSRPKAYILQWHIHPYRTKIITASSSSLLSSQPRPALLPSFTNLRSYTNLIQNFLNHWTWGQGRGEKFFKGRGRKKKGGKKKTAQMSTKKSIYKRNKNWVRKIKPSTKPHLLTHILSLTTSPKNRPTQTIDQSHHRICVARGKARGDGRVLFTFLLLEDQPIQKSNQSSTRDSGVTKNSGLSWVRQIPQKFPKNLLARLKILSRAAKLMRKGSCPSR